MDKNTKIIAAATAATAVSFFLPWIDTGFGGIAPSNVSQMGPEIMSWGTYVFFGSFLLAAITCLVHTTGKENAKIAIATGVLPFVILVYAILETNSLITEALGSNFDWSNFGQLFQVFGIGVPAYFLGSLVTVITGFIAFQAEEDRMSLKGSEPTGDAS
ncbi:MULTISPECIES: hypothetical protein [unclassified Sulfitobacter]|uniref:hypothetical protein n=1 Tax=unclassified Sulfitobacter TaxID=196795 RepID=UPI0023E092F0|nr:MULTISPECIES: hypothetical protein [unclassified Sulfitobacter]MDF3384511.1 hypothetical protein [Sulfitobacter sp. Ks11]MDF3387929.1 hypothetical protein [Sulfitobacter sp. M85]MDF3391349.1 hypothetical protein [Sulfitobacter sp. Ks16]MDF3401987.1 hypothetical protein [Sulfitobacter sp. KE39]MDF3405408.1 hypothetical protein [Sulfitobacter sp. Ks35]